MYRSQGERYEQVCNILHLRADITPIEVMVRNGRTYVRGTALKPDEARSIHWMCEQVGFIYRGPFARGA